MLTPDDSLAGFEMDALLEQLAALPTHDLDALRTKRTQVEARRVLARHRRRARRIRAAAGRLYSGYLEPALVTGFTGAILVWAFSKANFLLS